MPQNDTDQSRFLCCRKHFIRYNFPHNKIYLVHLIAVLWKWNSLSVHCNSAAHFLHFEGAKGNSNVTTMSFSRPVRFPALFRNYVAPIRIYIKNFQNRNLSHKTVQDYIYSQIVGRYVDRLYILQYVRTNVLIKDGSCFRLMQRDLRKSVDWYLRLALT